MLRDKVAKEKLSGPYSALPGACPGWRRGKTSPLPGSPSHIAESSRLVVQHDPSMTSQRPRKRKPRLWGIRTAWPPCRAFCYISNSNSSSSKSSSGC